MGRVETRGERNIRWIEKYCRIPKGPLVGQAVKLDPFQKDIIRDIYDLPTRRYILSIGRKNAKTALAAFLVLLHLVGPESQQNGELYSTALSREQAARLFHYAAKCIRLSPALHSVIQIVESKKRLLCPSRGTSYEALSSDAPTALGLSPAFCVHDELGSVKGPTSDLYDAIETAAGAEGSPLSVIISTQAASDGDLLSILIDDAVKGFDTETRVKLYTCPMEVDAFSETAIRYANPAFDTFMNQKEVLQVMEAARRIPSKEATYRNLVLNQRVQAEALFCPKSLWEINGNKPFKLSECDEIYGGLDLAAVNDLCALVLAGKRDDSSFSVHPTFWLPEKDIAEKAKKDRKPYEKWHKKGHLVLVPGAAVEYEWIAARLREVFDEHGDALKQIAFDRFAFKFLRPWLVKAGFSDEELAKFVEFGQGFQSMGPAMRAFEACLLNGALRHGNHPVLTDNCANAVAVKDPSGAMKLAKNKSHGKIDGMVALAMAIGISGFVDENEDVLDFLMDPVTA